MSEVTIPQLIAPIEPIKSPLALDATSLNAFISRTHRHPSTYDAFRPGDQANTLFYVADRILRTLHDLCHEPDALTHPDGMQIRVSRQELSRITGCSREMAGRVLKQLQEQKLLTTHGKTIVVFGTR